MPEQVAAHVRLNVYAHHVSEERDNIVHAELQQIDAEKHQ